jgi:hypothetical protein
LTLGHESNIRSEIVIAKAKELINKIGLDVAESKCKSTQWGEIEFMG